VEPVHVGRRWPSDSENPVRNGRVAYTALGIMGSECGRNRYRPECPASTAAADESGAKEGKETVMQCSEPERTSVLVGLPSIVDPLLLWHR
jgi:hypothetical protein